MSRLARPLLFAALIACHAMVTLCGPCLHELAGTAHTFGPVSGSHRPDTPAQSTTDSGDNCLLCQFVAQGQLTIAPTCSLSAPLVLAHITAEPDIDRPTTHHVRSSPRAPPARSFVMV